MTNLKQMIADQEERHAKWRAATEAEIEARRAKEAGHKALAEALVAASGYTNGDVIKTADGREAKIVYFRLYDGELKAYCQDRTKAGKWSQSPRLTVKINVKVEEAP